MKNADSSVNGHVVIIERQIREVLLELERTIAEEVIITESGALEAMEKEIVKTTDRLAGLIVAQKIQQSLDSSSLKGEACELVKAFPKKMKNQYQREVEISCSRGEPVKVKTNYYSQKEKRGRKRKRHGFYPALILLGIYDNCSPNLVSEIAVMATILSSFKEAKQILKDRGCEIDVKTIRTITRRCAERAKVAQNVQEGSFVETVAGCRVVVSTDGGRIRIRENKRGPKTKKGRNRYSTEWREPKLLIIYTVNEKGEMDRSFAPFIDGTLKGPNSIFGLIKYYLSKLDICKADKILFVADGARWIWNRVNELMRSLGISPNQFYELVDFYHAVEHLGKVAALRKGWTSSERKRWIRRHRHLLLNGKVDEVIDAIRQICKRRRGKKLRRELNYFVRNSNRMCYAHISALGLPIGSGAMESAIRRVINLRLKGASIYWHRKTAEAMLLLRSYYKAGRWDILKNLAFSAHLADVI
jgi:hypothetical protein